MFRLSRTGRARPDDVHRAARGADRALSAGVEPPVNRLYGLMQIRKFWKSKGNISEGHAEFPPAASITS